MGDRINFISFLYFLFLFPLRLQYSFIICLLLLLLLLLLLILLLLPYLLTYLLQLSCHLVAAVLTLVQTKQIRINVHKRNNTKTQYKQYKTQ